jgi:hypothetical protein
MNSRLFSAALGICLVTFSLPACSNTQPGEEDTVQTPIEQPAQDPVIAVPADRPIEQAAVGELLDVNFETSMVTIEDAEGREAAFAFTDTTHIVGAANTEGLSSRQGSRVMVHYLEQNGVRTAVRIEVIPR